MMPAYGEINDMNRIGAFFAKKAQLNALSRQYHRKYNLPLLKKLTENIKSQI